MQRAFTFVAGVAQNLNVLYFIQSFEPHRHNVVYIPIRKQIFDATRAFVVLLRQHGGYLLESYLPFNSELFCSRVCRVDASVYWVLSAVLRLVSPPIRSYPFNIFGAVFPFTQFCIFLYAERFTIGASSDFFNKFNAILLMALITSATRNEALRHVPPVAQKIWLVICVAVCAGFP